MSIFERFHYSGRRNFAKMRELSERVHQIGQDAFVPYRSVVNRINKVEIPALS